MKISLKKTHQDLIHGQNKTKQKYVNISIAGETDELVSFQLMCMGEGYNFLMDVEGERGFQKIWEHLSGQQQYRMFRV